MVLSVCWTLARLRLAQKTCPADQQMKKVYVALTWSSFLLKKTANHKMHYMGGPGASTERAFTVKQGAATIFSATIKATMFSWTPEIEAVIHVCSHMYMYALCCFASRTDSHISVILFSDVKSCLEKDWMGRGLDTWYRLTDDNIWPLCSSGVNILSSGHDGVKVERVWDKMVTTSVILSNFQLFV